MDISYIDGVGRVSVANGMVHIDLVTVIPPAGDHEQPRVEVSQHLVMGVPQFVRMSAEFIGLLQKLEERGVISRELPSQHGSGAPLL